MDQRDTIETPSETTSTTSGEADSRASPEPLKPIDDATTASIWLSEVTARQFWLTLISLFAMLLTYSLVQANIPGVNESHYLTKSRHVWDNTWGEGDLFLESSNPHLVFYRTVGWFAHVLPFPTAALVGRVFAYGLLAYAWLRLTIVLFKRPTIALISAAFYLLIATLGNWSGEWLIGGVESKVFAYGFSFLAASLLFESRIRLAGLTAGAAVAFHPIVGAWFSLAVAGCVLAHCVGWRPLRAFARPLLKDWALGAAFFFIAAAPGVIPALAVLGTGTAEQAVEASRYQVTRRLSHHLDPTAFSLQAYRGFALLIVLALVFLSQMKRRPTTDRCHSFSVVVGCSIVFATVGVLIGLETPKPDWSIKLLKFYPFRLADLLVPWFVAALLAHRLTDRAIASTTLAIAAFVLSLTIPLPTRDSSRMQPDVKTAWGDACWWIRSETPADALILPADTDWSFKWFAQRAEYVNYKDCPQDPPSIAEFRRRRRFLYDWSAAALQDGLVTNTELADFRSQSDVEFIVARRFGPFEAKPAFENERFRIYDLRPTTLGQ